MNALPRRLLAYLIFAALLFAVDRGLYIFFSKVFARLETVGLGEMERANAEVVVLGSSRACHHYDSEVIEKVIGSSVFNTGRDGLGVPYMRGVCDILLKKCNPKVVIIEVGPGSVLAKYSDRQMRRLSFLAPYMDDSDVVREMIYEQGYQQRIKYMSRAYRYNGKPMYLLYDLVMRKNFVKGFEALDKSFTPEQRGEPEFDRQGAQKEVKFNTKCVSWLRDTIRAAKSKDVDVLLVTSPLWLGAGDYESEVRAACVFLQKLADEESVPYAVVMEDRYHQFTDSSLFADASHLNREGAKVFSEIVGSILIEMNYVAGEGVN